MTRTGGPETSSRPEEAGGAAATASVRGSVELAGVTKRFGGTVAVDRLDLQILPGEFISLLGPSGCGKTTTLRILAGFEQPDEGFVRISGQYVQGVPPHKRDVNTVFQHFALFPHMTVAENVAYGLRQRREDRADMRRKVAEALDMVKMTPLAARKPRQLSGGQQQRVALARALVKRPSVLLLDEPLGALDRKLRQEMQIELKLLQADVGITFVFVTHDQEEALSMSDRIVVMLDGHVEQLADPDTVYDTPASAFVAGFIGQNNFLTGTAGRTGEVAVDGVTVRSDRSGPAFEVGQAALAAVRPEAVAIRTDDPGAVPNAMAGTVAGVSHLGDAMQFVVRCGQREVLARQARESAPKLVPGDTVWCTWAAHHVHLFAAEQTHLVLADPADTAAPA
jgi:spermidine/putrescine transport system ATP-binding protein